MTNTRNLFCSAAVLFFLGLNIPSAFAANTWYYGKVTQMITFRADGSFVVYIDNAILKATCAADRVQFLVSDMGQERTKVALSMALMAFASDRDFGVVVNLPGTGQVCKASSTASQGAGVKD